VSLKILIADDEQDVLRLTAKKVAEAGYDVVTAKDGIEAWELIQGDSPDIILLDLNMPGADGFSVLKQLRERPTAEKWQPVIIISTRGELEDIQKGMDLEAEHYLVKPCSVEDILKGIRQMAQLIPNRKTLSELEEEGSPEEL